MKISYNWLKRYCNTDLPADEVARMLTNCGLEVEDYEKKFDSMERKIDKLENSIEILLERYRFFHHYFSFCRLFFLH